MKNISSGTKEWSVASANFITGCEHNCLYCYSRATATYYNRKTQDNWKEETLRPKDLNKGWRFREGGRVMFPTSHDITPQHLPESIQFLKNILLPGNQVLIVSKPHPECIKAICNEFVNYKDKILFRFSIGSTDNDVLNFWEPGAPTFEERLSALKYAYKAEYETSISCEPMLDNNICDVIDIVRQYVTHSIWLGKMNKMKWRLEINTLITDELKEKANRLYSWQSDKEIMNLYQKYKSDPLIKWKAEIKKVVGLTIGKIGSNQ